MQYRILTLATVVAFTTAGLASFGACKTTTRTAPAAQTAPTAPTAPGVTTAPAGRPATAASGQALMTGQALADLTYLSSDELMGRYTGTPGNEAAAAYIARSLAASGVKAVGGGTDLMVPVKLIKREGVSAASLSFGESPQTTATFPDELLPITREAVNLDAPMVYLAEAALKSATAEQVKGKIVLTDAGGEEAPADPRAWFELAQAKQARLTALGAVALVEIYRSQMIPFKRLVGGVNGAGFKLDEGEAQKIPLLWVTDQKGFAQIRDGGSAMEFAAELSVAGARQDRITSNNVIGVLPGTDPALADEYIAVTAHFDHIGVTHQPGVADSINNGARDNGMGTVALMEVARRWRDKPGKRPLLLMAWTGEEVGLLGSTYWAENPTVPLYKVKFNFNLDGAGYDDTTGVVINGYGRTSAQDVVDAAVAKTGLRAMPDPMPQYGLFRQSDNYSLAVKGIPALNMAPGFTGFSEELMKYYHQPADEITAINPRYLQRYADVAVAVARALSDLDTLPVWKADDEYAETAKALYND